MAELPLPADVLTFVTEVFRECNERITEKLSRNPSIPEESLDLTWIEHLSQYSAARVLPSNWTVKMDVHYLGGLRHHYNWEIADIGVLLFIRRGGKIERSKVALLQSKRLYPTIGTVEEEGKVDYEIGFGRLADPEVLAQSIAVEAEFNFSRECRYGALIAASNQVKAITDYEEKSTAMRLSTPIAKLWGCSLKRSNLVSLLLTSLSARAMLIRSVAWVPHPRRIRPPGHVACREIPRLLHPGPRIYGRQLA